MSTTYDSVDKGTELPSRTYQVTRLDLVKYAGASGDFNVIHWNERVARSVGLPNVIAHGMYTMAEAGKFVTEWAGGDPGAVTDFGVKFSAMVPVPDDDAGATIGSAARSSRNSRTTRSPSTSWPGPTARRC